MQWRAAGRAGLFVTGFFVAFGFRPSLAADFILLAGHAEARGYSEAADWDTNDGFGETNINLA